MVCQYEINVCWQCAPVYFHVFYLALQFLRLSGSHVLSSWNLQLYALIMQAHVSGLKEGITLNHAVIFIKVSTVTHGLEPLMAI